MFSVTVIAEVINFIQNIAMSPKKVAAPKSKALNLDACPRPQLNVMSKEERGEVSILDSEAKNVFTLDGASAEIWLQLNGKRTLKSIAAQLSAKYKIEPKLFETLTLQLMEKLKRDKLITF